MAVGFRRVALALALVAVVPACGPPPADNTPDKTAVIVAPQGKRPAAYMQCVSCHSPAPGIHGIGPSLANIYGGKAGGVAGFAYSPALRNSGLTWDDATLDAWLASPRELVPGNRMSFYGMPDPARRKLVIDYLKTLK